MNLAVDEPRLDTTFAYTGLGSLKHFGWPGYKACDLIKKDEECYNFNPTASADLEKLRSMPFGLGQPTSGKYDLLKGGWKTFGAQG
jgi:hypothetical protein